MTRTDDDGTAAASGAAEKAGRQQSDQRQSDQQLSDQQRHAGHQDSAQDAGTGRSVPGAWPLLGHAPRLLRDPLGFLEACYPLGPAVRLRLGPVPAVLVNGADAVRRILVEDADRYDKGFQFDQLRVLLGDGVGTSYGLKHRRNRRLLRPAFDHRRVEGYVRMVATCADDTARRWIAAGRVEAAGELRAQAMTAIIRAMEGEGRRAGAGTVGGGTSDAGHVAAGSAEHEHEHEHADGADSDARSDADADEMLAELPALLGGIGRRAVLPLPVLDRLPTPGNRRFEQARAHVHGFADRMVADHRDAAREAGALATDIVTVADGIDSITAEASSTGTGSAAAAERDSAASSASAAAEPGGGSLIETVLRAVDDEGRGMTDAQVHDEIMTLLLAGTETTAGTLAWLFRVLAADRALQDAVRAEADAVLQGRSLPTAADLARLSFTRRVITEVLRLYPAGWVLGRRALEEVSIAGMRVPAGTQVLLNFYGLHRDPVAFPEPDRFDPDRWLDAEEGGGRAVRASYLPFGLGPHSCLGEGFAWSQLLATAAVVTTRCTLRPGTTRPVRAVARTTLHPAAVPLIVEARAAAVR